MRNSLVSFVLVLAVVGGLDTLISARQQSQPGVSPARFWINNRTREEAIPINLVGVDPKAPPVPVSMLGTVSMDFTDRAVGTLSQVQGRTQSTIKARQPWEYREVTFTPKEGIASGLNSLGTDGWEMAGMTTQSNGNVTVLMKRPR